MRKNGRDRQLANCLRKKRYGSLPEARRWARYRTNRTSRRYEVANGDQTLTFPAGVDGRREAFQTVVQVEDPALYRLAADMAADHPQLASRIWRAAEIVLMEGVTFKDGIGLVASQSSEYGDYTVQFADGLYTCDCQDFQGATAVYMEGNEQPYCKHILAYHFALVCAL